MPRSDARIVLAGNNANPLLGFVEGRAQKTRNKLIDARTDAVTQDTEQRRQIFDDEQQRMSADDAERQKLQRAQDFTADTVRLNELVKAGDRAGAARHLVQRRADLVEKGLPTEDTDHRLRLIGANQDDRLSTLLDADLAEAEAMGLYQRRGSSAQAIPAGTLEHQQLLQDLESDNPDVVRAARIKLRLDPGAGTVTGEERIATDENLGAAVANQVEAEEFSKKTGVSRAKAIDTGFEAIQRTQANVRNLDRAIAAIDDGASSGVIEQMFPTFRQATLELEQVQKELGLDVIGSVTFGALSEGELQLALETALPTGLQPEDLKNYLVDRKAAQEKLISYYQEQVDFLDQGGTVAQFVRQQQRKSGGGGQEAPQQEAAKYKEGQTATNPETGEKLIYQNGQWVPQ